MDGRPPFDTLRTTTCHLPDLQQNFLSVSECRAHPNPKFSSAPPITTLSVGDADCAQELSNCARAGSTAAVVEGARDHFLPLFALGS